MSTATTYICAACGNEHAHRDGYAAAEIRQIDPYERTDETIENAIVCLDCVLVDEGAIEQRVSVMHTMRTWIYDVTVARAENAPVAHDRDESEPCQRGTIGCAVNHDQRLGDYDCETW